jgi:Eukaryotic protein of unknown function (DUF829)
MKTTEEPMMTAAAIARSACHIATNAAVKALSMQAAASTATATTASSRHVDDKMVPQQQVRPLVVLAGWLGCQPKSLRRYRQLYQQQDLNCDVLLCIAPPSAVVQSVFSSSTVSSSSLDRSLVTAPIGWPFCYQQQQQQQQQQQSLENNGHPPVLSAPSMEALAWHILARIDQKQQSSKSNNNGSTSASPIIFHAFSNGGCFVWEKVRAILDEHYCAADCNSSTMSPTSSPATSINTMSTSSLLSSSCRNGNEAALASTPSSSSSSSSSSAERITAVQKERLVRIRRCLRGVVFDSCPGTDLYRIHEALQYCTWQERINVILETRSIQHWLLAYHQYPKSKYLRNLVDQREAEYRRRLQDDAWHNVLQLYFYAENDALIDYAALDALVEHRRQMLSEHVVWKRTWKESRHCAHLLYHPHEYQTTIRSFVAACRSSSSSPPPSAPSQQSQQQREDGRSSHHMDMMMISKL